MKAWFRELENHRGKFKLNICPIKVISPTSIQFINLYHLCKTFNSLPNAGGVFDQDNRTMEAFEVITSESNKIENEETKKIKNKTNNAQNNVTGLQGRKR